MKGNSRFHLRLPARRQLSNCHEAPIWSGKTFRHQEHFITVAQKGFFEAFTDASPPTISQSVYVGVIRLPHVCFEVFFAVCSLRFSSPSSSTLSWGPKLDYMRFLKTFSSLLERVNSKLSLSSWELLREVWYWCLTCVWADVIAWVKSILPADTSLWSLSKLSSEQPEALVDLQLARLCANKEPTKLHHETGEVTRGLFCSSQLCTSRIPHQHLDSAMKWNCEKMKLFTRAWKSFLHDWLAFSLMLYGAEKRKRNLLDMSEEEVFIYHRRTNERTLTRVCSIALSANWALNSVDTSL